MWSAAKKTLFHPSALGLGLLIVFIVAVIGCGSGMMPAAAPMHGGAECSGMFASTFVISHKELGAMQSMAFLLAVSFLLAVWGVLLLRLLISQQYVIHSLLRARSNLLRLYDHILQQFSAGILHPQIY